MSSKEWEEKAKSAQKAFEKALKGEKEPSRKVDKKLVKLAVEDILKARDKLYSAYTHLSDIIISLLGEVPYDVEAVLRIKLLGVLELWDKILRDLHTMYSALKDLIQEEEVGKGEG